MTAAPTPTALTDDEVARARSITPGCDPELGQIHLNHAGCSLPPGPVLDTQLDYLRREATHGGYEIAAETEAASCGVYDSIAALLGAEARQIARFEHATAAWNAAFWSLPMAPGQRILVHDHEYGANAVAFLRAVETRGVIIERVPCDESGQVSVEAMERSLTGGGVALVSLTHVPTNGGVVNPAAEIGALTAAAGVPYLVDACQSAGQIDLDVTELRCDFLSATGRKYLRGPRGTGFLYVGDRILDRVTPSQPDHHGTTLVAADRFEWSPGARRFEYWEYNHAAWLGLGVAVDHALGWGLPRIERTVAELAAELRSMLRDAGFVVFDQGARQCGIVTVTADPAVDERAAADLGAALTDRRINFSITHEGSSRYDVERRGLRPMLRLSVHYTNTLDEMTTAVDTLAARH